jgi:hypothetical protein
MSLNKTQMKAFVVAPMVTGSMSFIASLTIIIMILRSNVKLSTIYRRIIFGISVFDLLQSLSQIFSTVAMEQESGMWAAIGNTTSCEFKTFFGTIGGCGAVLYSLSLTLYFLLVVKYDKSETVIKKKFEPYLHGVPILYSCGVSIYTLATKNFNQSGPTCWIDSRPSNCRNDSDVDCESIGNPVILKWIAMGIPIFTVFIGNCFILGLIWRRVRHQVLRSQMYRQSLILPQRQSESQSRPQPVGTLSTVQETTSPEKGQSSKRLFNYLNTSPLCRSTKSALAQQHQNDTNATSPLAARLSRPSRAMVQRLRDISSRAYAYIVGYLMTYSFSIIFRLWQLKTPDVPFIVIMLARILYPLQGFFNVVIYTYPHVVSCRRNHGDYSWLKAFWEVLKSGGDSDQVRVGRMSQNGTLRQQRRVLEASRRRSMVGKLDVTTNG